ncbi:AAA family ATPase [Streptomyces sp. LP05-1]|uniref:AAA family ATPase n=1 Tax=Streptomyces pyxinae TaxID=2970734 RepID=A0ABT2CP66_9ACTN|nr:AAA family ATPase [Streptomyces sp. LP05-1]MCS0639105.1 AAA family ATPase [Streptomyces sp. LP05-1]
MSSRAHEENTVTPFLRRIRISDYRSIASCDVRLGPLTVLAGPNAAGKSNFLDAIRFVRDALRTSPGQALEARGGLEEVLHRDSTGRRADTFCIRLEVRVPVVEDGKPTALDATYLWRVGANPNRGEPPAVVLREELSFDGLDGGFRFPPRSLSDHQVVWHDGTLLADSARGTTHTSAVYFRLLSMHFYELLTPVLRDIDSSPGQRRRLWTLGERGAHLARVLDVLAQRQPWAKETIDGYLAAMIENAVGLDGVEVPEADLAYLVGRFAGEGGTVAKVDRRSLSDGTLRLGGVLAALFQPLALQGQIPFVGIEEPEISLHPPVLGALYDALVAASRNTQVLVTTQSADLLDNAAADPAHLLVVRDDGNGTRIGPIDRAGRGLLADGVLSLPDLLRSGEMRPEPLPAEETDEGEGEDAR